MAATRSGAAGRSGCRRRPRPSPATCPRRWASPFSLARARRLGIASDLPEDAIVCCSFGDASANHATALSAINTARYGARIGLPMPILFVCEDNGTGISVPTPEGWIAETYGNQPHLRYWRADGELDEIWEVADAGDSLRPPRSPARLPPPAHRAAVGPRRQRRGARLPPAGAHRRHRGGRIRCSATRAA